MPPKGGVKRKTEPTSEGASKKIKVQLVEGEQDAQNLDFHSKSQAAWAVVTAKFPDIESEAPLKIIEWGRASAILST